MTKLIMALFLEHALVLPGSVINKEKLGVRLLKHNFLVLAQLSIC